MKAIIMKFARWALFLTLCFIGFSAFLLYVSETAITYRLLIAKALAMAVLAICVLCGKWLKKKGYLPEYIDPIRDKE